MLRYPGGCLAHNFDWKKTVGPLAQRPDWHFGLDEYLEVCRGLNAEPIITVSDYRGTPQDAADLVEYLNALATPSHPWAQKRAAWGHPRPYGVRWFEMGNESDHGNHNLVPFRQFNGDTYAAYAMATAHAMRAIDPTIKIGIQAANDIWNEAVFTKAGSIADFVIVHRYPVQYEGNNPDVDQMMLAQACMAAGEQEEALLWSQHAMIKNLIGRDLPIGLTEYNVGVVQDNPHPFRFGYAEALFCADYMRILLKPASNIAMANYWQLWNGYWGIAFKSGTSGEYQTNPVFPLYRLWAHHFGATLVSTNSDGPRLSFAGFSHVAPTDDSLKGVSKGVEPLSLPLSVPEGAISKYASVKGSVQTTLKVHIANAVGEEFPLLTTVSRPSHSANGSLPLRLSCEARFIPDAGSSYGTMSLILGDSRGWASTHSAVALEDAGRARDWHFFEATLNSLPDAQGIDIRAKIGPGNEAVSGTLEIRGLRLLIDSGSRVPRYAALTSTASLSKDGKTLYVMVFNKTANDDIDTHVVIHGFQPKSARKWTINGPSLTAGSWSEPPVRQVDTASVVAIRSRESMEIVFPAHSMTALEFQTK
ncbi:MAG: alpha-L-arabinofuranosidase C-terminal domain-containing protein [Capsulimonadaceae bacterium]|nr:alpha-L-arabinofuranosidase C-terminal domain-containing protein [Capsulimonadaceae bacterium]